MGGMEVVGRNDGVLNRGDPKDGSAYPPGGDPHDVSDGQYPWPVCGGVSEGWPKYRCGGGRQKPGPVGGQNPAEGGSGHVGGALTVGDPPHWIEGTWLLWEVCNTKKIESCLIIEILA
jgi:hypothetical protein